MRSIEQINKKISYIFFYIFYYLFGAIIIILFFFAIYSLYNYDNTFILSWEIFWLVKNNVHKNIIVFFYIERIANSLFSLIIVGNILTKFLLPLNPILFSKYISYDTVDRIFTFKYWIMVPKNNYLYNIKIRILLAEYETHQKGVNKIKTAWELDSEHLLLNSARGIRHVELSEKDSSNLIKEIEKIDEKHIIDGKYLGGEFEVDFFIDGESENGTKFHNHIRYKGKIY